MLCAAVWKVRGVGRGRGGGHMNNNGGLTCFQESLFPSLGLKEIMQNFSKVFFCL